MWNGPVKSSSAEPAELLFAFEQEGLGFLQTRAVERVVFPARGQERQLLRLGPQVEEATE